MTQAQKKAEAEAKAEAQKKAEAEAKAEAQKKAKAKKGKKQRLLCNYKDHKFGDVVELKQDELKDVEGYFEWV